MYQKRIFLFSDVKISKTCHLNAIHIIILIVEAPVVSLGILSFFKYNFAKMITVTGTVMCRNVILCI